MESTVYSSTISKNSCTTYISGPSIDKVEIFNDNINIIRTYLEYS
ncbi:hypothetical protein [uncultured Methanobrevibacter sp.]|nr:hypothetical protein [uncultured Methanobrevibacter sp.]